MDVFMQRRVSTMAFAPRMMVFPGGGVDPRDADPDLPWAGPLPEVWGRTLVADEATARELVVAAVREVFEECGVLLAGTDADTVVGDVSGPRWQEERAALVSHEVSLAEVLGTRSTYDAGTYPWCAPCAASHTPLHCACECRGLRRVHGHRPTAVT